MKQYLGLCRHILKNGEWSDTRTGVRTLGVFGAMCQYDLRMGFPVVTTKRVLFDTIVDELLWMISGGHNIYDVNAPKRIWDDWRVEYRLDRDFTWIQSRLKEYVPYYDSDYIADCFVSSDEESFVRKVYHTWHGMMNRCYNVSWPGYQHYGGKKVSVCKEWHSFETFIKDIQKLPHWWYKQRQWRSFELDKDYYGSNQYSPDTCVWLHERENNWYSAATPIRIINVDGKEMWFLSIRDAARALQVSHNTLLRWLQYGEASGILRQVNEQYRGWLFEKAHIPSGYNLRLKLIPDGELGKIYGHAWRHYGEKQIGDEYYPGIDQLQLAIDRVKKVPNSRRNIVTAWNEEDIEAGQVSLPPCHLLWQLRVIQQRLTSSQGEEIIIPRLDMAMYQRSADLALGVPFNITSYALLLALIANECEIEAGILTHFMTDVHIYENHLEKLQKQIVRPVYDLPQLVLSVPRGFPVVDVRAEHIALINYQHHPFIHYPVAV